MLTENRQPDEGLEALKDADWIVSKIGGLNACDFQGNFDRISQTRESGKRQAIVISVLRTQDFNTTTHLNRLAAILMRKEPEYQDHARLAIQEIEQKLRGIIEENVEPTYQTALLGILDSFVAKLHAYVETAETTQFHRDGTDFLVTQNEEISSISAWGEDLMEALYKRYFLEKGKTSAELNINRQEIYKTPDVLRERYHEAITAVLDEDLLITGGYEADLARSRSYSDPKAALITESLAHHGKKAVLAIEKQQGILSADPSFIEDALAVRTMSSKFAAEVFGIFGAEAGALHHLVLPILNGSNAKVVVYNPAKPELGTTCIYRDAVMKPTTVVSRKFVPTIRVYGPMSNEKGIAEKVMHALRKHSLDQIYTAENEVRVTLSASGEVEHIEFDTGEMSPGYTHKIEGKCVVMCISTDDEIMRGNTVLKDNHIKVEASSFLAEVGDDPQVNVSSYIVKPDQSTEAVTYLHNAFAIKHAA